MSEFKHVRRAIFNQPWALTEEWLDVVAEIVDSAARETASGRLVLPPREKPKLTCMSGIPIIPIEGVISKRMPMLSEISGGTSIQTLNSLFDEALAMDSKAIGFAIDSPGGSVDGVAEFASRVFDARQTSGKTIFSIVDSGQGCSAAYWIGSQADEMYATEGSTVGSIGVRAKFMDDSRALKNQGIDSVSISSDELKGMGDGPMTPAQMTSIMKLVQQNADSFKAAVKRGRPQMDMTAATGAIRTAREALSLGMIDGITTLDKVVAKYATG